MALLNITMSMDELKDRFDSLYTKIMTNKTELEKDLEEYDSLNKQINELKEIEKKQNEFKNNLPDRYKKCKNTEELFNLLDNEMKNIEEMSKINIPTADLCNNEDIIKRMVEARASMLKLRQ